MEGSSFFQRLKSGLTKSRENWAQKIGAIFQNRQWDEESLDAMEENLIEADLGPNAAQKVMDLLRRQSPGGAELGQEMSSRLQQAMVGCLRHRQRPQKCCRCRSALGSFSGVNGVGKRRRSPLLPNIDRPKKVLLVAADTFRAAAIEQLDVGATGRCRRGQTSDRRRSFRSGLWHSPPKSRIDVLSSTRRTTSYEGPPNRGTEKIRQLFPANNRMPPRTLLVLDATTDKWVASPCFKEATDISNMLTQRGLGREKS
jgi:fused signal recognition particle receptor